MKPLALSWCLKTLTLAVDIGSGLWCLSPLSTIFLLHRGGQVYGVYHRFQQYFCYIVVVRFMVFITAFNNISVTSWGSGLMVENTAESHRPVASH
jgi:hypothetical protein